MQLTAVDKEQGTKSEMVLENCKHKRMALPARLPGRGTRREEMAEVVWTLQFHPRRSSHCVRVGIIVQVLVDAPRLMRNVCNDMSGWLPKHFRKKFAKSANSNLEERMPFGSDGPELAVDRWMKNFEAAPFMDEARTLIHKENALRLLGETG